ncbi:MAG: ATP-binding protein, partial [Treponema sp.]|nr:ATP-binding protein [Treponema sp.]
MQESFSITPRVIAHLGEALIKNESIAILELVKNSYDANATKCEVFFEQDKSGELKKIVITDNGDGMNLSVIENNWLVIGIDNKKLQLQNQMKEEKKSSRFPLGEKGVGRLGVHKLGNEISLISKTLNDKEVSLKINWKKLETVKEIKDFTIGINENENPVFFNNNAHGTKIEITSLKTSWDRRKLRDVYRGLLSLNSPFSKTNDDFKIEINSNSNLFAGLPTFEDIKES